ncbi:MAG TPA: hypothetical protein VFM01_10820, partial [Nakamurella sp.]|nr:hypothetical protein [Nakamurella sp.]
EGTPPVCNDGEDNDGDGLTDVTTHRGLPPDIEVDHLGDPGCESATDTSEHSPRLLCDNGVDDDADGVADFSDDPACTSLLDASEFGGACSDDGFEENDANGDGLFAGRLFRDAPWRGVAATAGVRCPDDDDVFRFASGPGDLTTYTVSFDFDPAQAHLSLEIYNVTLFCVGPDLCSVFGAELLATIDEPTAGNPLTITETASGDQQVIFPFVRVTGERSETGAYAVRITNG